MDDPVQRPRLSKLAARRDISPRLGATYLHQAHAYGVDAARLNRPRVQPRPSRLDERLVIGVQGRCIGFSVTDCHRPRLRQQQFAQSRCSTGQHHSSVGGHHARLTEPLRLESIGGVLWSVVVRYLGVVPDQEHRRNP